MKTGIHLECMNECYVFRSGFKKVGPIRVCPFTLNRGISGLRKGLIWGFNLHIGTLNLLFDCSFTPNNPVDLVSVHMIQINHNTFENIPKIRYMIFLSFFKYLVNVQDQISKRQVTPMLVHPYLITSQSQTSPEQTI